MTKNTTRFLDMYSSNKKFVVFSPSWHLWKKFHGSDLLLYRQFAE